MSDPSDRHAVEHLDAAATLPEREPVRLYGTLPTVIVTLAGSLVSFGIPTPREALIYATAIVILVVVLEIVRSRVSPSAVNPFTIPDPDAA